MLKGFGGGDGYASAFIFSLLKGKSIPDALEFATASASMLVSAHSCSAAMPTEAAVEAFIRESKAQYGEVIEAL
ncbi:5-dehydro-2-deoxygluconokinase [bioreactor metagenome]|uniref:5-dehydro-2-deoxygluconokinase n=1 Tax=bioreactor metagenome TaxID=1076179 RepID=A0A645J0D9_9ZZZZ